MNKFRNYLLVFIGILLLVIVILSFILILQCYEKYTTNTRTYLLSRKNHVSQLMESWNNTRQKNCLEKLKSQFDSEKGIISFSLWGDNTCYNWGALENALIAEKLFPGWVCRYYIGKNVIPQMLEKLKALPNTEIIDMSGKTNNGMTWRFEPCFEENCPVIVRDTDSLLNMRDLAAVNEWLKSDRDFHIIRDHKRGHRTRIMGGMFGVRNGILKRLKLDNIQDHTYGVDQNWLRDHIYPKIKNNAFIHDTHNHFPDEKGKVNKIKDTSGYTGFIGEILCNNYKNIKMTYKFNPCKSSGCERN